IRVAAGIGAASAAASTSSGVRGRDGRFAGVIPRGASIKLAEGQAVEGAAFESNAAGGHFESRPLTGGGQRSHVAAAGGSVSAVLDQILAPISAMLPASIVPLEHDLARHICRVDINVSKQGFAGVHGQRAGCAGEEMLVRARADARLVGAG